MTVETKLTNRLGKILVLPLAISLLGSLSLINACAASVTATHNGGIKKPAAKAVKAASAKRVASRHKNLAKMVAERPAEVVGMAPALSAAATQADLALKKAQALAMEPAVSPAASTPAAPPPANPYLANQPQMEPVTPWNSARQGFSDIKLAMPQIPLFEQAILPKIQTVYPTGEKPLVVVTFKCPTELVGIDTPSTLILHKAVNGGMDIINRSNLLAFNMQQVCQ